MEHHKLDPYPEPKEKTPLYVNEPWLVDVSLDEDNIIAVKPKPEDNVRIYVPLDLNGEAILRRLHYVIYRYGESTEANEFLFSNDVRLIIAQLEIYDQVWKVRHMPKEGSHSVEAKELAEKIVRMLEEIPDGCSEIFPFDVIEELREEFGIED